MSKKSRRPNREKQLAQRKISKKVNKLFQKQQRADGFITLKHATITNHKCKYGSVDEEIDERTDAATEHIRAMRQLLPILLKRLSKIPDPRNPKKSKHKLTVIMIYGILTFVYQMSSRREANRTMTRPIFMQNLQLLFPELETIPHNDTLMRLLARIDVQKIESAHIELLRRLIRNKKFRRYLINKCYPIAIDGTQKMVRGYIWSEECQQRKVKSKKSKKEKKEEKEQKKPKMQYYVYVLEASLAFYNGLVIPMMSEFLNYAEGDISQNKQDCELKAFKRLAKRLKKEFGKLKIMVLIDGLYPNGPIMELCITNHWQFMIVLQDKSLKSVWDEYEGLKKLLPRNFHIKKWGNRKQRFEWVNNIDYYYESDKKKIVLHVVTCLEKWQETDLNTGEQITKTSKHAWISSKPLTCQNVHERCNLAARHRWGIESGFLVEKHQGYNYEHCFSYNWNAMIGYHYLMRLAHMFNVLAQYSVCFVKYIKESGVQGTIQFIRETMAALILKAVRVKSLLSPPLRVRLL